MENSSDISQKIKRTLPIGADFRMNPLFDPTTPRGEKTNMEKIRKLIPSESPIIPQTKQSNLPSSWIYDDPGAEKLWRELEAEDVKKRLHISENGPFKQIDESAARIRKTISNYEVQDQDLLMTLIDIVGDDTAADTLNESQILWEAQARLEVIITEHVGTAEKQEAMLNSLRTWFSNLQRERTGNDPDLVDNSMVNTENTETILNLLEQLAKEKEGKTEKAVTIHHDIVESLMARLKHIEKMLQQKQSEASQSIEEQDTAPDRRKRRMMTRQSNGYDTELALSQKKVLELENTVARLRQYLVEYGQEIGKDHPGNEEKLAPLMSLEKEMEFDQKIGVLSAEIRNLKATNTFLQRQLAKNQQAEMAMEKKLQMAESAKKIAETNAEAALERLKEMTQACDEQPATKSYEEEVTESGESLLDIVRKYETKIRQILEENGKKILALETGNEQLYSAQVKDLMASFGSHDPDRVVSDLTDQMNQKVDALLGEMDSQQARLIRYMLEMSENYEMIIRKRENEIEALKNSHESQMALKLASQKVELSFLENDKIVKLHAKHMEEMGEMRADFVAKIRKLKNELEKVTRQRDSMRSILETNLVAADMLDELALDSDADEEEEKTNEDDILAKSLDSLKERELEQKVLQKYNIMLQNFKSIHDDHDRWMVSEIQNAYVRRQENELSEFREEILSDVNFLSNKIPQNRNTLEDFLASVVKKIAAFGNETYTAKATLSLEDVDARLKDLKAKLIQCQNERDIWEHTFQNLRVSGGHDNKVIMKAMKKAIAAHAEAMARVSKERDSLLRKSTELPPSDWKKRAKLVSFGEIFVGKTVVATERKKSPRISTPRRATLPRKQLTKVRQIICTIKGEEQKLATTEVVAPAPQDPDRICCNGCKFLYRARDEDIKEKNAKVFYTTCPKCQADHPMKFVDIAFECGEPVISDEENLRLKKLFIENSRTILQHTKEHGTKKSKRLVISQIISRIKEFNMAPKNTWGEITELLEKLKMPKTDSNQLITQCRAIIDQIALSELNASPSSVVPLLQAPAQVVHIDPKIREFADDLKVAAEKVRKETAELIDEHKILMQKIRNNVTDTIKRSADQHAHEGQVIEDLKKQLSKARTENAVTRRTLQSSEEKVEEMHAQLENTLSRFNSLMIEQEMDKKNRKMSKDRETEAHQSYSQLADLMSKLREDHHSGEQEIENLKLQIQIYEDRLALSEAKKSCKLTMTEHPIVIFSTSDDFTTIVPPICGIGNIASQSKLRVKVGPNESPSAERIRLVVPKNPHRTVIARTPRANADPFIDNSQEGNASVVVYVTPFAQERPSTACAQSPATSSRAGTSRSARDNQTMHNFKELEKRILVLEQLLIERTRQVNNESRRAHEANQLLFKAGIKNQRVVREAEKMKQIAENTKAAFTKAMSVLAQKDDEILKLRRKIRQYHSVTEKVINRAKEIESSENNATPRAPTREGEKAFVSLISAFKDDELLTRMAKRDIIAFQKMEDARVKYINEEQSKWLAAMSALCFLTQPDQATPTETPRRRRTRTVISAKVSKTTLVPPTPLSLKRDLSLVRTSE